MFKLLLKRWLFCCLCLPIAPAHGRSIQPFYEDPFDLGAGGATLTWATQEGMLINNPALMVYGGKFMRWLGLKSSLMPGKDSVELARKLLSQAKGGKTTADSADASGEEGNASQFLDELFVHPLHLGAAVASSVITQYGGLAVFAASEPDITAWEKGDPETGAGTPNVVLRTETYGGAYFSLASRSIWRWLSFGLSAKYLMASEVREAIELVDTQGIKNIGNISASLQETGALGAGMGLDSGFLLFFQGKHVDLRLAGTVVNGGGLRLQGRDKILPQMLNAGLGLTLHSTQDAIHLAADFRDITNASQEPLYRHLYTGVKFLLRTYIGLAAGLYHGSPTYGLELDFILFRIAAATYTREYANTPGLDPRPIYVLSYTTGSSF